MYEIKEEDCDLTLVLIFYYPKPEEHNLKYVWNTAWTKLCTVHRSCMYKYIYAYKIYLQICT